MLAIYRVGFQIEVPILDHAKVQALSNQHGGVGDMLEAVAMLSASRLRDVTIFGLGIMPYISASIIFQLLGSVYPPLEQLQKEGQAGQKKDQRIYALRHVLPLHRPKLVLPGFLCRGSRLSCAWIPKWRRRHRLVLENCDRADHDSRHDLPHVARRANRRVRHRQRHQLVDHGRHSRPDAIRWLPATAASLARTERWRRQSSASKISWC